MRGPSIQLRPSAEAANHWPVAIIWIDVSVGNIASAIDHECPGYGKYPSAICISFLEIETGAFQDVLGSIIHFKGETELFGGPATVIDQDRKFCASSAGIFSGSWCGLR